MDTQLKQVLTFVRRHKLAVQSSVNSEGRPQSAVVGIVASDAFELFFDTLETSRKCQNLRKNAHVALVVGWDLLEGRTVQIEGRADEPRGEELARLKRLYFEQFPDGVERQGWAGITYVRIRPSWLRYSDFSGSAPLIAEFDESAIATLSVAARR